MIKLCKKKTVSKREKDEIIKRLKEKMKKNKIVKKKFKEYGIPISKIDDIDMSFADMDVSAKTKDKRIFFNSRFLDNGGDFEEEHYCPHELVHYLQQATDSLDRREMDKDYLDNKHEQEAFKSQIEYKKEEDGPREAKRYVNQVLDHHDVKGKERKEKKKRLLPRSISKRERIDLFKRAKSNYKEKRKEESGNITYLYDEKHVKARNKKKAAQIEKLRGSISKVRKQVQKDIRNEDVKVRLPALAVALIDETYERVGNRQSAKELKHYGVTEWLVKHVKFSGGKATIKYVGKSGVSQKKEVKEKAVVTALKNAVKGKKSSDQILSDEKFSLNDNHVNHYLRPFKITAKDIRGLHANEEMLKALKSARSGTLPKDEKERQKKLKEEFKKALEETAKIVGHEASTLKSQYLTPDVEEKYMKNGKV